MSLMLKVWDMRNKNLAGNANYLNITRTRQEQAKKKKNKVKKDISVFPFKLTS